MSLVWTRKLPGARSPAAKSARVHVCTLYPQPRANPYVIGAWCLASLWTTLGMASTWPLGLCGISRYLGQDFSAPENPLSALSHKGFLYRYPLYKRSRRKLGLERLLLGVHFPRHGICSHLHFSRRAPHRDHTRGHGCLCCGRTWCNTSEGLWCG